MRASLQKERDSVDSISQELKEAKLESEKSAAEVDRLTGELGEEREKSTTLAGSNDELRCEIDNLETRAQKSEDSAAQFQQQLVDRSKEKTEVE